MGFHGKRICKVTAAALLVLILSSFFLAVTYYSELKKSFLGALSKKATAFAGQEVNIGDISFIPPGRIVLKNITIKNPDGFTPGELLKLNKLILDISLKELLDGRLHFRDILLRSPKLTLTRDEKGKLNISDKLMTPGESDITYRMDEVKIDSGDFGYQGDMLSTVEDVDLTLRDVSSEKATKTLLEGSAYYSGNRVGLAGWIYLRSDQKKFSLSLSGADMELLSLRVAREFIDTEKVRVDLSAQAEGDITTGFRLTSKAGLKNPGFSFFKKPAKVMRVEGDFLVRLRDKAVLIESLVLRTGEVLSAQMTGEIKNMASNPSYQAEIRIESLDLSDFSFIKGLRLEGILSSGPLAVRGNFERAMPSISGSFSLADGTFGTDAAGLKNVNASVALSSEEDLTAEIKAHAGISRVGGHTPDRPVGIGFAGTLKVKPEKLLVSASLSLSPFETHLDEKKAGIGSLHLYLDGVMKDRRFSGDAEVEAEGLHYAGYALNNLKGGFGLDYAKNGIDFRDIHAEGGGISSSAQTLKIRMPEKKGPTIIEAAGLSLTYPKRNIEVGQTSLILHINKDGSATSTGDIEFSARKVAMKGLVASGLSGNGKFTGEDFAVRVDGAEFGGGEVRLSVRGRLGSGFFPIETQLLAENIQLQALSGKLHELPEEDYQVSGDIRKLSFTGAFESTESISGNTFIDGQNISVIKKDIGRNVIGNASFHAEAEFRGTDLSFKAQASSGQLSLKISGEAKDFLTANRTIKASGSVPRIEAAAVRETFWGVFPDSLLYTGLDGYLSSLFEIESGRDKKEFRGSLTVEDFFLSGENGEYSLGPVNGTVPLYYSEPARPGKAVALPSFELSKLEELYRHYSDMDTAKDFERITAGTFRYGFRILEDINILVKEAGDALNVGRFSATIFGGKLYGSALIEPSGGLNYRAGFFVKALSLTRLTEEIEPIKGYISGKVDGVGTLKGKGKGIEDIIGMADFRTYSAGDEKTVISREFLKELGGKSMKIYAQDRSYDKGVMSIYIDDGDVIFQELEISNRNFLGIRDLSIKVAPFSNRISIDNLLWSLTEAATRAQEKK